MSATPLLKIEILNVTYTVLSIQAAAGIHIHAETDTAHIQRSTHITVLCTLTMPLTTPLFHTRPKSTVGLRSHMAATLTTAVT